MMDLCGAPVHAFGAIGSTNSEALDRLRAGVEPPFWITAKRQDSGRGRSGRTWMSVEGNLYASLALDATARASTRALLSFVAALAVRDLVLAVSAGQLAAKIGLKWPNDVQIDGAKIAGILLESADLNNNRTAVVIGCGINCAGAPSVPGKRVGALVDFGIQVSTDTVFAELQRAFQHWVTVWATEGFSPIRAAWLSSATGLGAPIDIRLPKERIRGTLESLGSDGALIVRMPDMSIRRVSAGEVYFPTEEAQAATW